jgi:hypothetical protein
LVLRGIPDLMGDEEVMRLETTCAPISEEMKKNMM